MEGKSVGIETASESDLNEAENQIEFRPNLKLENLKNENIFKFMIGAIHTQKY